ncbi:glycosyltransferase [Rhodothermus profundi]|uniref:Glycosyltransferase involved in cell wall bisynthesis n=1 Tax=Rhodothermus profundi TaxID=633813 RepID=A0A1M6XKD8_9BACT|nr:glycosyltransferase [Rhodothermus profundi]SHL06444.1 Glycosyltransferase involved in cell wall bisynthesis [Rhodothermus profundi]
MARPRMLCISTAGPVGQDIRRIRRLTAGLPVDCAIWGLDRSRSRTENMRAVWERLRQDRPDLVYLEGTGIAAGLPLIRAARTWGQRYVVSSGDPVGGFFYVTKGLPYGMVFGAYERLLYRHCAGFIGWTPYLTGVALKLGAPRAITVEGGVDLKTFRPYPAAQRQALRQRYGIPANHLVCGVVGSLKWVPRQRYCYGLELVEMLRYLQRDDVTVLIVGDGDGRSRLEARVPARLQDRVVFTGRVEEAEVVDLLNVMNIGFITQTLDALGRYRLTTKLPEYLATGLPIAMSPIPGFYDYVYPAGWTLPEGHPADPAFHQKLAAWLDALSWEEVRKRAAEAPALAQRFGYDVLRPRFAAFISDLLGIDLAEQAVSPENVQHGCG